MTWFSSRRKLKSIGWANMYLTSTNGRRLSGGVMYETFKAARIARKQDPILEYIETVEVFVREAKK